VLAALFLMRGLFLRRASFEALILEANRSDLRHQSGVSFIIILVLLILHHQMFHLTNALLLGVSLIQTESVTRRSLLARGVLLPLLLF